jgi:hypothetical protein
MAEHAGGRTSEEVFDNAPVQIVLGGREFGLKEPGNRRRRALMRALAPIVARHQSLQDLDLESGAEISALEHLEAIDDMLDWLYQALEVAPAFRAQVDDAATEDEISAAFGRAVEVIVRPFVAKKMAADTQPPATPASDGPESTNSPITDGESQDGS